jgi:hypothetical protein
MAPTPKQEAISRNVDGDDDGGEDKLNMASEARWIDYGQQIALNEALE